MSLEEFKYLIPEESNGVIIANVKKLRKTENKLRRVFEKHNYIETLIPLFEYVDLYKSVYKNFNEEKIFKYIGKDGKVIALRWDFTIPIARHYFSQNTNKEKRYSYFGKVYRKEETFKGRNNESYQAGIELINNPGIKGDIECLKVLEESLQELKLSNLKLELGSAKFFYRLCDLVDDKEKFIKILTKKSISEMEKFVNESKNLDDEIRNLLLKLPRLCGDIKMLENVIKTTSDEIILIALNELKKIYQSFKNRRNIIFDLSMCPTMEYYTCIMFKVYSPYSPEPIVSGGRYDSLYKNFKRDVPAIGMGFYLNNILKAMEKEGEKNDKNSSNKR